MVKPTLRVCVRFIGRKVTILRMEVLSYYLLALENLVVISFQEFFRLTTTHFRPKLV